MRKYDRPIEQIMSPIGNIELMFGEEYGQHKSSPMDHEMGCAENLLRERGGSGQLDWAYIMIESECLCLLNWPPREIPYYSILANEF
jgi:hypothetical protein